MTSNDLNQNGTEVKMEAQIIKVKCPYCGTPLGIRIASGKVSNKNLTCPVCKQKSPLQSWRIDLREQEEQPTEYPSEEEPTIPTNDGLNFTLGQLTVMDSDLPAFRLKVGKNVVGRKASASSADIQLSVGESKRLSREHLTIEVKKVPGKGFVHIASLYKLKSNATYLNDNILVYGDAVILQHGDVLKLPDISLQFALPDEDGTELD